MRRRFVGPLAVLAVAAPFLLVACGGSSDSNEDEDQITDVISTSATSGDPEDCTTLQTQNFNEQSNFSTGDEALKQCEEDAKDTEDDPDSVDVSDISVDGDTATADVAFNGGGFDGTTITVALVKDGDQWKLDEITDIPELNAEGFKTNFAEGIPQQSGIPPQIASCIVDSVNQASDDQIKHALIGGTEDDLVGLFGDCIPGT